MFKWQICYTAMTNLLQFTINVRKSRCQPRCTLRHVEDHMSFVWVDIHISLYSSSPKCKWAICLVYPHFFFVNYALHPTPQIKMKGTVHARFKQFRIIFIYVDFFSHSDQYYHLRNFDLSSWITLYKWQELCLCCCFRTLNISFKLIYCVLWLKKDDRRV